MWSPWQQSQCAFPLICPSPTRSTVHRHELKLEPTPQRSARSRGVKGQACWERRCSSGASSSGTSGTVARTPGRRPQPVWPGCSSLADRRQTPPSSTICQRRQEKPGTTADLLDFAVISSPKCFLLPGGAGFSPCWLVPGRTPKQPRIKLTREQKEREGVNRRLLLCVLRRPTFRLYLERTAAE